MLDLDEKLLVLDQIILWIDGMKWAHTANFKEKNNTYFGYLIPSSDFCNNPPNNCMFNF